MPRIRDYKRKYKLSDLSKFIIGEMAGMELTQTDMADALKITQQAFSKKLKNNQFTYSDLLTIFKVLQTTDKKIVELMKE